MLIGDTRLLLIPFHYFKTHVGILSAHRRYSTSRYPLSLLKTYMSAFLVLIGDTRL